MPERRELTSSDLAAARSEADRFVAKTVNGADERQLRRFTDAVEGFRVDRMSGTEPDIRVVIRTRETLLRGKGNISTEVLTEYSRKIAELLS